MHYLTKIKNIKESCSLNQTPDDAQGFLLSKIIPNFSHNDILYIAKNDIDITKIEQQIRFFGHNDLEIIIIPAWDCLPYDSTSPKPVISSQRIKNLYKLATRSQDKKFLIITSINAFIQKTVNPDQIKDLGLYLGVGSKISIEQIANFLIAKGYERQAVANDIGDFAVRGGIIDIVMQQAADLIGYRLDFFGEEVESIKIFDPLTQISQEEVKNIEILPASEIILNEKTIESFRKYYRQTCSNWKDDQLYSAISHNRSYLGMEHFLPYFYDNKLVSLLDYLKNPVIFYNNSIKNLAAERDDLIQNYYQSRIFDNKHNKELNSDPIDPNLLYKKFDELDREIKNHINIEFNNFQSSDSIRNIDLEIKPIPDFALAGRANKKDPIELFKDFTLARIDEQKDANIFVLLAFLSQGFCDRISKILPDYAIYSNQIENLSQLKAIKNNKLDATILPCGFGFYTKDFLLIGEQALFGEKKVRQQKSNKNIGQRLIEEGLAINQGELVVHRDHGIGKFDGIHTIEMGNIKNDMIKIIYGGDDTLFVPVDDISIISRYGADNPLINLDRLGASAWKNRKDKVKKRIKIAAEELLKIAAARKLKKAPIFQVEQHFYDEFCRNFAFVETDDQLQAINEVEEDLSTGSPMDRLICGDVGFGKTEVAMRAAAIVVSKNISHEELPNDNSCSKSGKEQSRFNDKISNLGDKKSFCQVAIVTPTTLLCRQHYKNFKERFAGTNLKIVQLSRLIKGSDAKKIRQEIEDGKADIVIGTHALLQNSIKFKNLSLVIIDEEQHFGVAQKEKLKKLRNEVHLLNLSATPIPRTLQMSLTGVKDLSLIATPPLDRLSVRNFVMPYNGSIAKEAIMREFNRGGKIFFVVPRVRDLQEIEPKLKKLLPELKITHAHGQMTPTELDDIMNDFSDGKTDLLLSTTIIESGIDISSANTMIIYKAEMFGLSQLYQLRGRVGRGKLRGYCYFMLDKNKKLKAAAKKKLEVMQNLDSLGVGFNIASHDMDIRGSGNLIGDEQSGHIRETGVELYQQMLLEAIDRLKNSSEIEQDQQLKIEEYDFSTQIKLGISLLIPEDYISDLALRMSFYKKIALIKSDEDHENISNEMNNRFGKLPQEITNLIEVAKLKNICRQIGIEKLESKKDGLLVTFRNNKFKEPDKLLQMVFSSNSKIKINPEQKLLFICYPQNDGIKIQQSFAIANKLKNLCQ